MRSYSDIFNVRIFEYLSGNFINSFKIIPSQRFQNKMSSRLRNQLEEYRRRQGNNWRGYREPIIERPTSQTQREQNRNVSSRVEQVTSDEELARRLQEQFDRELEQHVSSSQTFYDDNQQIQQNRRRLVDQNRHLQQMRLGPTLGIHDDLMDDDHDDLDHAFEREMRLSRPSSLPVLNRTPPYLGRHHPDLFVPGFENDHFPFERGGRLIPPMFIPQNPFLIPPTFNGDQFDDEDMSYEQLLELQERLGNVNRGASQNEIEGSSLKFKIERDSQISSDSKECMICFDEYKVGDEVRRLPCMHLFHADEIDKWLQTNRTCPICKTDVKEANRGNN